jgi:hypothetical protein
MVTKMSEMSALLLDRIMNFSWAERLYTQYRIL